MRSGLLKFLFPYLIFIPRRLWACFWVPFVVTPLVLEGLHHLWRIMDICQASHSALRYDPVCKAGAYRQSILYTIQVVLPLSFAVIPFDLALLFAVLQKQDIKSWRMGGRVALYGAVLGALAAAGWSFHIHSFVGLSAFVTGAALGLGNALALWLAFPVNGAWQVGVAAQAVSVDADEDAEEEALDTGKKKRKRRKRAGQETAQQALAREVLRRENMIRQSKPQENNARSERDVDEDAHNGSKGDIFLQ